MNFKCFGVLIQTQEQSKVVKIGGNVWFLYYYDIKDKATGFLIRTPYLKLVFRNGNEYFSERYGFNNPIIRVGNWRLFSYKTK